MTLGHLQNTSSDRGDFALCLGISAEFDLKWKAITDYRFKMSLDLIILIAAVIVAWLVFTWLIKIVKVSLKTALAIAAIVLILQLVFGIGPRDLWEQMIRLPETIREMSR